MSEINKKEFKKNTEISDFANVVCEKLKSLNYFIDKKDAYRTAICIAISYNLDLDANVSYSNNLADTNAVFFENGSSVADLMILFGYEYDEIFYYGRMLAEAGLKYLNQKINSHSDILDILVNNKLD